VASDHQRILILCKTYPSPSARYVETSCVAGMTEDGRLVRLFPVPFRLVEDEQQFKKWQWISARVRRAQDDARPESHRVSVDTIQLEGERLPTRDHWIARREVIKAVPVFDSFAALDAAREADAWSRPPCAERWPGWCLGKCPERACCACHQSGSRTVTIAEPRSSVSRLDRLDGRVGRDQVARHGVTFWLRPGLGASYCQSYSSKWKNSRDRIQPPDTQKSPRALIL
jgi:hypothetical protein